MSFPSSPSNNQTAIVNGITYVYNASKTVWTRQTSQLAFSNTTVTIPSLNATSINVSSLNVYTLNVTTTYVNAISTNTVNVGSLSYNASGAYAVFGANANTYQQLVVQNANNGTQASADVVVSNDVATDSTFYGDFGINSSRFSGIGSLDAPNTVYLIAASSNLAIGTVTSNSINFVVNHGATDAMSINPSGAVLIPGTANISNLGISNAANITSLGATTANITGLNATNLYANNYYFANGSPLQAGGGGSSSGYLANTVITANSTGYLSNTTNLNFFTSNNNLVITGNIIAGGVRTTTSSSAPTNATVGDIWYETTSDIIYRYTYDGSGNYWLDITGPTVSVNTPYTISGYSIGYLNVPQNLQSNNYVLSTSDQGKHIFLTLSANTTNVYIPTTANVAFPVGTAISIVTNGLFTSNVIANTGVSLYLAGNTGGITGSNTRQLANYSMASLLNVAANTWYISGVGVT